MAPLTTDRKAARKRQLLAKKVGRRNPTKVKKAIQEMAGVWIDRKDIDAANIRKEAWTRK